MEHIAGIAEYLRTEWLFVLRLIVQIGFSFGVVVFIHELGHFLAAKLVGVGATDFALGMGPEIYGFQWGETRCKLCLFPIGGYVKLIGEEDEEVTPELAAKSLRNKNTLQKITVIVAGPFMNFILAIALFAMVFMVWGVERELPFTLDALAPVVIAGFVDPREPAGKAGMQNGDTIISINNFVITEGKQVRAAINSGGGKPVKFVVKRGFGVKSFTIQPKKVELKNPDSKKIEPVYQVGIAMFPPTPRVVESVIPSSPAAAAGLKNNDIILDFDKQDFSKETRYITREAVTKLLVISKGGKPREAKVTLARAGSAQDIGIVLAPVNRRLGLFPALSNGTKQSLAVFTGTINGIRQMISREVSAGSVSGPIGIIQYASTFARSGLREFISFFAIISVSLAFINLVPFPALDGSLILFFLWEGITRRPLDPRKQGAIIYVGFCVLIGMLILLTLRDLRMWLGI